MKRTKASKPYWEMSKEELAQATKQFDQEIDLADTKPLTKAERAQFERIRRGPVRSIRLKPRNAREVNLHIDEDLLQKSAKYAKAYGITRDELISRMLRKAFTFVEG